MKESFGFIERADKVSEVRFFVVVKPLVPLWGTGSRGGGALDKVLYGEAPPRGSNPYPLIDEFLPKWHPFRIPKAKFHPFFIPQG